MENKNIFFQLKLLWLSAVTTHLIFLPHKIQWLLHSLQSSLRIEPIIPMIIRWREESKSDIKLYFILMLKEIRHPTDVRESIFLCAHGQQQHHLWYYWLSICLISVKSLIPVLDFLTFWRQLHEYNANPRCSSYKLVNNTTLWLLCHFPFITIIIIIIIIIII